MAALNPFEIFGLKPQFRIDKQKLDESILRSKRRFIPTVLPRQATLKNALPSSGQR